MTLLGLAPLTYRISYLFRDYPDGSIGCEANWDTDEPYFPIVRLRTERQVPVPSVRDAKGQNLVAQCLRRAGFDHRPAYHPERRGEQ